MADVAKKRRSQALSNVTRAINNFNSLIDDDAPSVLVKPQFVKVQSCWEKLETAQDDYIEKSDIDLDNDDGKYGTAFLVEPEKRHSEAMKRYSEYLKKEKVDEGNRAGRKAEEDRLLEDERIKREAREQKVADELLKAEELEKKFGSAEAEFVLMVDIFKSMNAAFRDSLEDASDTDKRKEWNKFETDFKLLQNKLATLSGLDPSKDLNVVKSKFTTDAETLFQATQKWILGELRNSSETSGGDMRVSGNSTKKESVRLPSFQGHDKSSPYLKFPIWKKQWDAMILEYEVKYRAGLLWDHVDETARGKFTGYETEYEEAMERISQYYGNPSKVVYCVMQEVTLQSHIVEGDYTALVSYSVVLENNYNRLRSMQLEHEMSNTTTMTAILRKFPRMVSEKWYEHLLERSTSEKSRPFPIFIDWLKSRREMWECMVSSEYSKSKRGVSFAAVESQREEGRMSCFGCGEEGHILPQQTE